GARGRAPRRARPRYRSGPRAPAAASQRRGSRRERLRVGRGRSRRRDLRLGRERLRRDRAKVVRARLESAPVPAAPAELRRHLAEIKDLARIEQLLSWDMEVWMPQGGQASRASQIATLAGILHTRRVDDRIGELTEELAPYADSLEYDSDDACIIRVART